MRDIDFCCRLAKEFLLLSGESDLSQLNDLIELLERMPESLLYTQASQYDLLLALRAVRAALLELQSNS